MYAAMSIPCSLCFFGSVVYKLKPGIGIPQDFLLAQNCLGCTKSLVFVIPCEFYDCVFLYRAIFRILVCRGQNVLVHTDKHRGSQECETHRHPSKEGNV